MNISFPGESDEYRAARERLLTQEVALRRETEAVAVLRRALPPGGLVREDYVFDGLNAHGMAARIKLSEMFAPGRDTLVIYNFMFPRDPQDDRPGPSVGTTAGLRREDGPCPSCVALLDQWDGAAMHIEQQTSLAVIAKAPLDRLITFSKERGWRNLRLFSAAGNTFKRDYRAETKEGFQRPMLTVFHRVGNEIRHFWSSEMLYSPTDPGQDPRHAGTMEPLWNIFDLTPEGRPCDWDEQLDYHCCHAGSPR